MTNIASGTKPAITLKDSYRWRLFAVLAVNLILLYVAAVYDTIQLDGIRAVASDWERAWKDIGAVALAAVATTILNGILSPDAKARIVFWRWRHPLPGCRAFSHYLKKDVRIGFAPLRLVPALCSWLSSAPLGRASSLRRRPCGSTSRCLPRSSSPPRSLHGITVCGSWRRRRRSGSRGMPEARWAAAERRRR